VTTRRIEIAGAELEVFDTGGPAGTTPILFLHGAGGFRADDRYVGLLSHGRRVIAPTHPGFGTSTLPDWLDAVDDIAYLYLELIDRLKLGRVDLVGASLGGWIAAEIATKTIALLRRLVLVGPVGVKTGPADRLDIPDVFAMPAEHLQALLYHDPEAMRVDPAQLSADQLTAMVRNRETLALLAWEPYMHNPKLKHRLHRVQIPTLLLRGVSDGLVSADYLARYAALFPNARSETIAAAGHLPQLEQPEAFAATVLGFLAEGMS